MKLDKIDLDEFNVLRQRRGCIENGEKPLLYYLYQRKTDNSYWEGRPLDDDEDAYYSGGPLEYVSVAMDYVMDRYPDVVDKSKKS